MLENFLNLLDSSLLYHLRHTFFSSNEVFELFNTGPKYICFYLKGFMEFNML